jgi:hypothetical protein
MSKGDEVCRSGYACEQRRAETSRWLSLYGVIEALRRVTLCACEIVRVVGDRRPTRPVCSVARQCKVRSSKPENGSPQPAEAGDNDADDESPLLSRQDKRRDGENTEHRLEVVCLSSALAKRRPR